jgi:hypothetical protein
VRRRLQSCLVHRRVSRAIAPQWSLSALLRFRRTTVVVANPRRCIEFRPAHPSLFLTTLSHLDRSWALLSPL